MGESLAHLHRASDDFVSAAQRFRLDPAHLIEQPVRAIHKLFFRDREALTFLDGVAPKVAAHVQSLPLTPPIFGPCHGVHFENFCRLRGDPLWLDFDCSGLGWRVYDVATFYGALKLKWVGWTVKYSDPDDAVWRAFVDAYQTVRAVRSKNRASSRPSSLLAPSGAPVCKRATRTTGQRTGGSPAPFSSKDSSLFVKSRLVLTTTCPERDEDRKSG